MKLSLALIGSLALLQACTGGEITDGNGNVIKGGANADLVVTFQNTANGRAYSTGIDANGIFSFDGYAAASASNQAVMLPEGTYQVSVTSKSGAAPQSTPYLINHTFNNKNCPDGYNFNKTDPSCALYQLELLGDHASGAPYAGTYANYATTVIPLSSTMWCAQARAGFGVANVSPRYNDINFRINSQMNIPWGYKVTSGNLNASGEIAANARDQIVDLATKFQGPPYYIYPNTNYTVSFYPGGLHSACRPMNVNFRTTYDPVPECVIDHTCNADPTEGDDFSEDPCNPGGDCCRDSSCWPGTEDPNF